jgi:hypothetical protein
MSWFANFFFRFSLNVRPIVIGKKMTVSDHEEENRTAPVLEVQD